MQSAGQRPMTLETAGHDPQRARTNHCAAALTAETRKAEDLESRDRCLRSFRAIGRSVGRSDRRIPGLAPHANGSFAGLGFGEWCNGSTADSDSACLGSNPSSPATIPKYSED